MPLKGEHHSEEAKQILRWARALQPSTIIGKNGITSEIYNRAIEAGQQWCRDCKSFQNPDKFYGKDPRCKECGKARIQKVRDKLTPEQRVAAAAYMKDWRAGIRKPRPVKIKATEAVYKDRRKRRCLTQYGVTQEWYEKTSAAQGGHCAMCDRTEAKCAPWNLLHIDHCHKTGKVRGLLCHVCNVELGRVERDGYADWYQTALAYVERHK